MITPQLKFMGNKKIKPLGKKYVYKNILVPFKRKNNLVSGLGLVVPFLKNIYEIAFCSVSHRQI